MVSENSIKLDYVKHCWGSVESYVDALYWMRFVLKLNNQELDEMVGSCDFHKHYKMLGWYYNSYDFDECLRRHAAEQDSYSAILNDFDVEDEVFLSEEYRSKTAKRSMTKLDERARKRYRVSDVEELSKVLYYLVYVKKLTTSEVAIVYGVAYNSIIRLLKVLGMELTRKEARKRIEENGRGNHHQQHIVTRQQMAKRSIENGINSNNVENVIRSLLDSTLPNWLDTKEFTFVIGISTYSILQTYEVDIPVMIQKKETHQIYRFAIEVDGDTWHNKPKNSRRDRVKEELLCESGWKLIRIVIASKIRSKEARVEAFKRLIERLCEVISSMVLSTPHNNDLVIIEGYL